MKFAVRAATGFLGALVLVTRSAAADATPHPPPTAEELRLGETIAHVLFKDADLGTWLTSRRAADQVFASVTERPEWQALAKQAMTEELDQGRPDFDRAFGAVLARRFTLEELTAGAQLMQGPAGEAIARSMGARAAGRAPEPLLPEAKRAWREAGSTPAGHAFIEKLGDAGTYTGDAQAPFVTAFTLGLLQRFDPMAIAAEEARQSQNAPSEEARALGAEIAKRLFASADVGGAVLRRVGDEFATDFDFAPAWPPLINAAVQEEFTADGQDRDRIIGADIARYFTIAELRTGAAALRTDDGAALADMLARGARGEPVERESPALHRLASRLAATTDGRAFLRKFGGFADMARQADEDYGFWAILHALDRFIAKAKALDDNGV